DVHLLGRVLDQGGQRAVPAELLAAEGEPPAGDPARALQRGVRRPLGHSPRIQTHGVRRVERHARSVVVRGRRSGWLDGHVSARRQRVVVLGGGPGGYEAALVAAQLGAEVTVVDRDGLGGACVLTDCVPSKALIAIADARTQYVEQEGTGSAGAG